MGDLPSSLHSTFKQVTLARTDFGRRHIKSQVIQNHIKRQGPRIFQQFTHCGTSIQCFWVFFSEYSVCLFFIPFSKSINEQNFRTRHEYTSLRPLQVLYWYLPSQDNQVNCFWHKSISISSSVWQMLFL